MLLLVSQVYYSNANSNNPEPSHSNFIQRNSEKMLNSETIGGIPWLLLFLWPDLMDII